MYRPGVDVVVVNYKTSYDLNSFCTSLFADPLDEMSLVIANVEPYRADTEAAYEWMDHYEEEEIGVVQFPTNVGYATAVNQGAFLGDREVLAIFNADITLIPGCLQACYDALKENPSWGVVGPRQHNKEGRMVHAGIFGFPPKHRGWLQSDDGIRFSDVLPAHSVSGSAYVVRRSVWDELTRCPIYQEIAPEAVGAFLPTPFYFEEEFCSVHAQAHGHQVTYLGTTVAVHDWHSAVRTNKMEGWATRQFQVSSQMYKRACEAHDIRCHI